MRAASRGSSGICGPPPFSLSLCKLCTLCPLDAYVAPPPSRPPPSKRDIPPPPLRPKPWSWRRSRIIDSLPMPAAPHTPAVFASPPAPCSTFSSLLSDGARTNGCMSRSFLHACCMSLSYRSNDSARSLSLGKLAGGCMPLTTNRSCLLRRLPAAACSGCWCATPCAPTPPTAPPCMPTPPASSYAPLG